VFDAVALVAVCREDGIQSKGKLVIIVGTAEGGETPHSCHPAESAEGRTVVEGHFVLYVGIYR